MKFIKIDYKLINAKEIEKIELEFGNNFLFIRFYTGESYILEHNCMKELDKINKENIDGINREHLEWITFGRLGISLENKEDIVIDIENEFKRILSDYIDSYYNSLNREIEYKLYNAGVSEEEKEKLEEEFGNNIGKSEEIKNRIEIRIRK